MIKILLVGVGYWGKNWYKTIISRGYDLVVVDQKYEKTFIDENKVMCFNNLNEVFKYGNSLGISHVIIATGAREQIDVFEVCSKYIEKHKILVEKPCGFDTRSSAFMEGCFPGYLFLYSEQFKYVKTVLEKMGKVYYVKTVRASMGPRIRTDCDVVVDYMIHDIYILLELFGNDFSNCHTFFQNNLKINNSDKTKSDTANVIAKLGDINVSMFSSWVYPIKTRQMDIVCEYGNIVWRGDEVRISNDAYHRAKRTHEKDQFGNLNHLLNLDCEREFEKFSIPVLDAELIAFLRNRKSSLTLFKVWDNIQKIRFCKYKI